MDDSTFRCERGPEPSAENRWRDRLVLELDPRLADVWSCLFRLGIEGTELLEQIGWFLRMAYLQGYEDGLTEPRRGALLANLGLDVPDRPDSGRRGARR